jgi:hypothetical protein
VGADVSVELFRPQYFPEKRDGQKWMWFAYEQKYYFPIMQEEEYMSRWVAFALKVSGLTTR